MTDDTYLFRRIVLPCVFLVLLSGCGGRRESDVSTDLIRETLSDGVTRLAYTSLPDRSLELDTLTVIDPWDENLGYHFSRIGDILGSDDSLLLMDSRNREIVEVGLDGTVLKIIGREGAGPGEFSRPGSMGWKGEELWVSDSGHRRMSIFDGDGILLHDFLWPSGSGSSVNRFRISSDGQVHYVTGVSGLGAEEQHSWNLARFAEGGGVDTLRSLESDPFVRVTIDTEAGTQIPTFMPPIFTSFLWWSLEDDVLLLVDSMEYRIEFCNLEGSLAQFLEVSTPDLTVTAMVRNHWQEDGWRDFFTFLSGDRPTRESLNQIPFADRRQAVIGLDVDPLGRIWVLASTEDPGVNRLDIFDWEGNYLGNLGHRPMPDTFLRNGAPVYQFHGVDELIRYAVLKVR